MVVKISERKRPTGITRLFFRAPIWLYKLNLGWLMGNRMLRITHTGRVSGVPREVVLEVVRHDPSNDTYYIAAAWGEKSDWVKNVRANPQVKVHVSRRKLHMLAKELTPVQGETTILDYSQRHPTAMKNLASYMGYQVDGSESDYRELGRMLLMFSLTPRIQGSTA